MENNNNNKCENKENIYNGDGVMLESYRISEEVTINIFLEPCDRALWFKIIY